MNELLSVAAQVGTLFFYVFLGFLGRKKQILKTEGDKVISDVIFYFTMPALAITSMNLEVTGQQLANAWYILAFAIALVLVTYILTILAGVRLQLPQKKDYAFRFAATFANVAYMGFPVAYILFGRLGVFYAAMYTLGHNLLFLPWASGLCRITNNADWTGASFLILMYWQLSLALYLPYYVSKYRKSSIFHWKVWARQPYRWPCCWLVPCWRSHP